MKRKPRPPAWTPTDTSELVEIILRRLPAIILSLAALVMACLAPEPASIALGVIISAMKAVWK